MKDAKHAKNDFYFWGLSPDMGKRKEVTSVLKQKYTTLNIHHIKQPMKNVFKMQTCVLKSKENLTA